MRQPLTRSAPLILLAALTVLSSAGKSPNRTLTATEASGHVGEMATVCGEVVSAKYASSSQKQPTFLNLDKPYPNHILTIVIWGSDRPKFGHPEVKYMGKSICVTGTIKEYQGIPEIIASDPAQIKKKSK
jgi:DNA/RNA endonuclease YhcR with UshA esterase domain